MLPTVKQTIVRGLDPHLGHAYLSRDDLGLLPDESFVGGCVRIGPGDERSIRVGVLGGSTSDISYHGSWVRPFRERCLAEGLDVTLYSGAVSGYTSAQEFLKCVRDLVPAAPRVIIALSGLNDVGFLHSGGSAHPMVHAYQARLFRWLLRKPASGRGFFGKAESHRKPALPAFNEAMAAADFALGAHNELSAAQVWERNARMTRAVCQELDVSYRCFLQPAVGVGDYIVTSDELESLAAYEAELATGGFQYRAELTSFYAEAREIVARNPDFMVDLVDIFRGRTGMYADIRHPNATGNELIAAAILDHVRGLL